MSRPKRYNVQQQTINNKKEEPSKPKSYWNGTGLEMATDTEQFDWRPKFSSSRQIGD